MAPSQEGISNELTWAPYFLDKSSACLTHQYKFHQQKNVIKTINTPIYLGLRKTSRWNWYPPTFTDVVSVSETLEGVRRYTLHRQLPMGLRVRLDA